MSRAIDLPAIAEIAYNMGAYAREFWHAQQAVRLKVAVVKVPGLDDPELFYLNEEVGNFFVWMQTDQPSVAGLFRDDAHRFSKQFYEDWPPFQRRFLDQTDVRAWPQGPQIRRRVVGPDGRIRSIRVSTTRTPLLPEKPA